MFIRLNIINLLRYYTFSFIHFLLGVDPETKEHKEYLEKLCDDFTSKIEYLIEKGVKRNRDNHLSNSVHGEVSQHAAFCQDKCSNFSGRTDLLSVSETYDFCYLKCLVKIIDDGIFLHNGDSSIVLYHIRMT